MVGVTLAFTLAGCGETVTEGPVESRQQQNTDVINKLRENRSASVKSGKYNEKPAPEKQADSKTASSKSPEK
jgi:hypothetical protein